jgi:Transketolase, N-terminal subunit
MENDVEKLKDLCKTVRKDILRMIYQAKSGHPGGSLSSVELLVSLYFGGILNHNPKNPSWEDRDRFILSKGHINPVLYSVLARSGYFPVEVLDTLRKFGSPLQGHPNMHKLPGLDSSSGSLGQGLSISNGLALASRMRNKSYRVYCLMGDGELQEGQVWEAAMTAAQHKLDNVCAIVDFNKVQLDGPVDAIKGIDPLIDKWKAFNWHVIEIDGHSIQEVLDAYKEAQNTKGKPSVIIANTIKGKGVSFMEGKSEWHGKAPNKQEYEAALAEIQ